jgi:hypothetical protein
VFGGVGGYRGVDDIIIQWGGKKQIVQIFFLCPLNELRM